MEIIIFTERKDSTQTIDFSGTTVNELLRELKVNPETVIVVRNNEVLLRDEKIRGGDKIKLLSVISGG